MTKQRKKGLQGRRLKVAGRKSFRGAVKVPVETVDFEPKGELFIVSKVEVEIGRRYHANGVGPVSYTDWYFDALIECHGGEWGISVGEAGSPDLGAVRREAAARIEAEVEEIESGRYGKKVKS